MEFSNDMDDIYKNIEEYNLNKKRKILIVFDDMIADMLSNNKLIYQRKKAKNFSCFHHTIIFRCSKKYQTNFNTLSCYENSEQKRTSSN